MKKMMVLVAIMSGSCIALISILHRHTTHNVDVDSRYGYDEWHRMSSEERTTIVTYFLMGKLGTAVTSCNKRLSSEIDQTNGLDIDGYTSLCHEVEGVSELRITRPGDITSEAAKMCMLIDQWYSLFPGKRKVPFLELVDTLSNEPIKSATDLDARFNSSQFLR